MASKAEMSSRSDIDDVLAQARAELVACDTDRRLLCLATTANVNNPPLYVGGLRITATAAAANVIISAPEFVASVIEAFDDIVDGILVDCEAKAGLQDLPQRVMAIAPRSPVVHFKPNDITVDAFDMLIALFRPDWTGRKVAVIGPGNIGAKAALRMAERGAAVALFGTDFEKLQRIVAGLTEIVYGAGRLDPALTSRDAVLGADLLLGCTPGVPAITQDMINDVSDEATIVDVGNGTLEPAAIARANERGLPLLCLTPAAGFCGFVEHWDRAQVLVSGLGRRQLGSDLTILSPGLIGARGDILVDDIEMPTRIIGICDGRGDILQGEEAQAVRARAKKYGLK